MQSEWIALKQLAERWNSFISRSETSRNNHVLAIVVYLVLNSRASCPSFVPIPCVKNKVGEL